VLTAAQVNTYLNEQTVMVFADSAARTTALSGVLAEGMMSYLQDTDSVEVYDGTSWTAVGGGGLSSPLTTKGDVWGYSTTDARIPVGANGTVLTADSAETLGVKWAAPASGGSLTLINTGGTTLTGATTTVSTIPGTYRNLYIVILNYKPATDGARLYVRANGDAGANRYNNIGSQTGELIGAYNDTTWTLSLDQDNSVSNSIGAFTIYEYANTAIWKSIYGQMLNNDDTTSTSISFRNLYGMYNQTTAISSLEFFNSAGNFTSGTVYVYGVL